MATYEYICLGCERSFELRRPMEAAVDVALACPSCGDGRVRRRFSVFATGASTGSSADSTGGVDAPPGGCCGGGACACR